MRIACPDCSATYDVPDAKLVPGRSVRCARCGRQWHPDPVAALQAADPLPPPRWADEPPITASTQLATAILDRAEPPLPHEEAAAPAGFGPPDPHSGAAAPGRAAAASARYAWAGSLLLLVVLGWAAYTWREPIMHAWPPSERVYAVLGLA